MTHFNNSKSYSIKTVLTKGSAFIFYKPFSGELLYNYFQKMDFLIEGVLANT